MVILKTLADGMPTHPSKGWTKFQMGIVREICCPACEKLFEWEGNFYEPQCPHCERILRTRHEQAEVPGQATHPTSQSSEKGS
jgi:phage FluMu protein Com